jgi:chromosome segregation protein
MLPACGGGGRYADQELELIGFKSFPIERIFDFPSGVTGVVGPNGCGKSNIVDAIRWVLGAQSPKHLRGDAMEAVVFNGNEKLSPLGMAEVSCRVMPEGPVSPATRPEQWAPSLRTPGFR